MELERESALIMAASIINMTLSELFVVDWPLQCVTQIVMKAALAAINNQTAQTDAFRHNSKTLSHQSQIKVKCRYMA